MNSFQIFELSINFICNRVVERLNTFKTLKEKETLFFDIVNRFNKVQCKELKGYYSKLKTSEKKLFFEDINETGIYIHIPPMWHDEPLFNVIRDIYKDYDWIKPVDVYVNRWGRKIKIMKPLIVGDLYMMKLKQSSKKGFSARSTGALSKKGVPEKSFKTKAHQDLYSSTPIRIGDQENINSLIGVDAKDIARMHLLYRSSVQGRRDLGKTLVTRTKPIKKFKLKKDFKNRNVEILQAYLKAMGLRIEFLGNMYDIKINTDALDSFDIGDEYMIGTQSEYDDAKMLLDIMTKYRDDVCFVGTNEEYEELVQKEYDDKKTRERCYNIDIKLDD